MVSKLRDHTAKDKIESYTIKLTKEISVPVVLEQNSTPSQNLNQIRLLKK